MLDQSQVQKIAHLARLEITPEEEVQFAQQLSSILDYFEQLNELPTEGVPPTTRAIEVSNIVREDSQDVWGDRQGLLDNAPEPEGDFFRVPQIMNTDED
ncbi:MAG: Asp-tRNA(Asn)/Glu-tRNA(Gln) amidotransferase subunit GatC [Synechocystis sp.]|jgi:aspartyl-tRNA(Asn)/glutamyl-tRNA(Gln) amidotransferase subunit C|nr:Asp-tRNA(Asn)/Glu-tRNA(Gln) amidotransferase subunit GatC [Synechocystis sp.]